MILVIEVKTVRGAKFFQKEYELLRLYVNEYSRGTNTKSVSKHKPGMPASTIAAYIVAHFYCDDFGRIFAKDFCLKHIAEENGLPYSSLYKGFKDLFELGLVKSVMLESQEYYILTGYEQLNSPEKGEGLNYFYIPRVVLTSGDLKEFIHARDSQGLIGLLELLNTLYRSNSRSKSGGTIKRYAKDFMEKFRKTSRNITDWIERISAYIVIRDQVGKKRKEKLWTFSLCESCYSNTPEDQVKANAVATLRKEVQVTLIHSVINFDHKAYKDIYGAMIQDGLDTFYSLVYRQRISIKGLISKLYSCHINAFDELIKLYKTNQVKSIGAYYRTKLRDELKREYQQLAQEDRIELLTGYNQLYKKTVPSFLTAIV